MRQIIMIPARMASTRLPGKPLIEIAGKTMIRHVIERAQEADVGPVCVACDHEGVFDEVQSAGAQAIMTPPDLPSGSDRIWHALLQHDAGGDYDVIVNMQGDLPTLEPHLIRDVIAPFSDARVDITTLASVIHDDDERENPNVVKAVVAWNKAQQHGKALYFSRAKVPNGEGDLYHHIGIYAYRKAALKRFTSLPPSALEKREKLEQLRALEDGMHIEVVAASTVPVGVDTISDVEKAEFILSGGK